MMVARASLPSAEPSAEAWPVLPIPRYFVHTHIHQIAVLVCICLLLIVGKILL